MQRIAALILIVTVYSLVGCQQDQPFEPNNNLFGENYQFRQIHLDSLITNTGTVDVHWEILGINPIGGYRDYTGMSLLKFESFGALNNVIDEQIRSVELVMPVNYLEFDTTSGIPMTSVYLHQFQADWDEDSESIDWSMFDATTAIDSITYPTQTDSITNNPLRFSIQQSLVDDWQDTSTANNGLLVRSPSSDLLIFANSRASASLPYLNFTVADTANEDSTFSVQVSATADYAHLEPGTYPADTGDNIIVQQSEAKRMSFRWAGLLDSLQSENVYIHSVSMNIVLNRQQSFTGGRNHQIFLGEQAPADLSSLSVPSSSGVLSISVSSEDTMVTVKSTETNTYLRRYIQRIVYGDSVNTGLILGYRNEGEGIQHLGINPGKSTLNLLYSEVQE
ncbi:MAG: hypothetical protein K9N46_11015 [Candidatus Marinimicrobia bacterium]|nr:hypothetical protein [Candidatus Neomarinimicrobiota bacterium]MCF7827688.1 hypothetical protein [Candidatus Neomarinimicrobiota bacterium]MCF7881257.1 hypothetical protein [Candidatus Neomarinimicrobiota bacterium]